MSRSGRARDREKQLEGVNLLGLAPSRLGKWEEKEEEVVLLRPPPAGRGLAFLWPWISYGLSARRVRLDPVGSFAWLRLDGNRTVQEVAELLRARFGEAVEPAEERLGYLVQVLRREGFLAYPGWDEDG